MKRSCRTFANRSVISTVSERDLDSQDNYCHGSAGPMPMPVRRRQSGPWPATQQAFHTACLQAGFDTSDQTCRFITKHAEGSVLEHGRLREIQNRFCGCAAPFEELADLLHLIEELTGGFLHLTWWMHPQDPTWHDEVQAHTS
jgi:hypothetical protein